MTSILRFLTYLAVISPLFLVGFSTGCGESGPELASVSGKLTKGGKPLGSVSVTFTSVEGSVSSAGLTNGDGEFVLLSSAGKAGAVLGKHKVTLSVRESGSGSGAVDYAALAKAREANVGNKGAPKAPEDEKSFGPEYGDPSKTPLEYEVKSGSNDFDIVLP